MGIPGFYGRWLVNYSRRNPRSNILSKEPPGFIAALLIDANALLHDAAGEVYVYSPIYANSKQKEARELLLSTMSENQQWADLFLAFINRIESIVQSTQPSDLVVIALDGIPSYGKMMQQRQRRYISSHIKNSPYFNANIISPGTSFMTYINDRLREWVRDESNNMPRYVIYSTSDTSGEGEQKIFHYLRQREIQSIVRGNRVVIYSPDADLIPLALASLMPNIYILRSLNPSRKDIEKFKMTSNAFLIPEMVFINIYAFAQILDREFKGKKPRSVVQDFVFLSFFAGNDFLPIPPSGRLIHDMMDYMLEEYKKLNDNFVHPRTLKLNWSVVMKFIKGMAQREKEMLININTRQDLMETPFSLLNAYVQGSNFDFEGFRATWYANVFCPRTELGISLMEAFPQAWEVTVPKLIDMVNNYFHTLEWLFEMYTKGSSSVDENWFYSYYYTPLFTDMAKVPTPDNFPVQNTSPPTSSSKITPTVVSTSPLDLMSLMATILPPESLYTMAPVLESFLQTPESSSIQPYLPETFYIDQDGFFYSHQKIAYIPNPNPGFIKSILGLYNVQSSYYKSIPRTANTKLPEALVERKTVMRSQTKIIRNYTPQRNFHPNFRPPTYSNKNNEYNEYSKPKTGITHPTLKQVERIESAYRDIYPEVSSRGPSRTILKQKGPPVENVNVEEGAYMEYL